MSVYYLICAERIEVKLLKSSQKRIFCFPQRFYATIDTIVVHRLAL